jgi:hypothetical protein
MLRIAEPMDRAATGIDIRHRARITRMTAHFHGAVCIGVIGIERFGERAFDHGVAAPGLMAVNRARLTRLPHERGDRVTFERIGGEQMAAVRMRIAQALIRLQQIGRGDRAFERGAHALPERRIGTARGDRERGLDLLAEVLQRGMPVRAEVFRRRLHAAGWFEFHDDPGVFYR